MKKTGELAAGKSRCDHCGKLAVVVQGSSALCRDHADINTKSASKPFSLKAAFRKR